MREAELQARAITSASIGSLKRRSSSDRDPSQPLLNRIGRWLRQRWFSTPKNVQLLHKNRYLGSIEKHASGSCRHRGPKLGLRFEATSRDEEEDVPALVSRSLVAEKRRRNTTTSVTGFQERQRHQIIPGLRKSLTHDSADEAQSEHTVDGSDTEAERSCEQLSDVSRQSNPTSPSQKQRPKRTHTIQSQQSKRSDTLRAALTRASAKREMEERSFHHSVKARSVDGASIVAAAAAHSRGTSYQGTPSTPHNLTDGGNRDEAGSSSCSSSSSSYRGVLLSPGSRPLSALDGVSSRGGHSGTSLKTGHSTVGTGTKTDPSAETPRRSLNKCSTATSILALSSWSWSSAHASTPRNSTNIPAFGPASSAATPSEGRQHSRDPSMYHDHLDMITPTAAATPSVGSCNSNNSSSSSSSNVASSIAIDANDRSGVSSAKHSSPGSGSSGVGSSSSSSDDISGSTNCNNTISSDGARNINGGSNRRRRRSSSSSSGNSRRGPTSKSNRFASDVSHPSSKSEVVAQANRITSGRRFQPSHSSRSHYAHHHHHHHHHHPHHGSHHNNNNKSAYNLRAGTGRHYGHHSSLGAFGVAASVHSKTATMALESAREFWCPTRRGPTTQDSPLKRHQDDIDLILQRIEERERKSQQRRKRR